MVVRATGPLVGGTGGSSGIGLWLELAGRFSSNEFAAVVAADRRCDIGRSGVDGVLP
jgi:hypothetical protein